MGNVWTKEEVDYFKQGLSDLEIMQRTGRTAQAVLNKRRKVTQDTEGKDVERIPPCMVLSQEEKESRIYELAERYGVKLLDRG